MLLRGSIHLLLSKGTKLSTGTDSDHRSPDDTILQARVETERAPLHRQSNLPNHLSCSSRNLPCSFFCCFFFTAFFVLIVLLLSRMFGFPDTRFCFEILVSSYFDVVSHFCGREIDAALYGHLEMQRVSRVETLTRFKAQNFQRSIRVAFEVAINKGTDCISQVSVV